MNELSLCNEWNSLKTWDLFIDNVTSNGSSNGNVPLQIFPSTKSREK